MCLTSKGNISKVAEHQAAFKAYQEAGSPPLNPKTFARFFPATYEVNIVTGRCRCSECREARAVALAR